MAFATSSFSRSFRAGERPLVITSASQLPNLEIWYDASDGTTNANRFNNTTLTSGTEITSWHNGGGLTSHDWNSTGGKRPEFFAPVQNGKGIVRFNGPVAGGLTGEDGDTDELLSINPAQYLQNISGATMFVLFKSLSTSAGTRICTSVSTGGYKWGQTGTQWIGGFAGATFTVNSITADTNYHHIALIFDGTQSGNANKLKARLDSVNLNLTFTGTVGNVTTASNSLTFYGGVDETGSANYWSGDIGELLIFTRALGTSEILAVEEYLTSKWGV